MISIIVAIGDNNVIGKRGSGLLWRLPADLKHFKDLTMGHPIIMGRRTYEAIGRPLPGRQNIVITRQPDFKAEGCIVMPSIEHALLSLRGITKQSYNDVNEIFIIGGGEIYAQAMPLAVRLYVTVVHHNFPEGDVYFPAIDKNIWREVSREQGVKDEKNIYDYEFIVYEKI